MIGCEPGPLRLTMRPSTWPVIGEPSVFRAIGTIDPVVVRSGHWSVAPALSPCQPLLSPTSPSYALASASVMRPPRFGTSCHIRPLAFDMSIGLTMKKVATYSTLPSGVPWPARCP